ncbi:MAG: tRNA epoxyqueuosine(34) reductase QueG [Chloroflexota bacterium]
MTPGPATAHDLAARVKSKAAELGFRPVGIASAEAFDADLSRVLDWLDQGMQAGMTWLTQERARTAADPATLLEGAQSIVVVGAPYAHPSPEGVDGQPRGIVARYARGADYHDVMKARLTDLAAFIREASAGDIADDGPRTRIFVDSSPLLERAAAVRAGLGFVGKNTNLLTAQAGSWLLLGAVLTTAQMAPDTPPQRDCGRCRLCLDACPTGALPEPFVLDANRCISYLTIEHRDAIPHELRPQMGNLVFGCDICQDVCPWNRGQRPPGWPEFDGDENAARPPLADMLALTDAGFRERYRRTPLWRTKRRGLARNAAVALGNVGTEADLPTLAQALRDLEPLVRGHAAWAIGRIGAATGAGRDLLLAARDAEDDVRVLDEIDRALAMLDTSRTQQNAADAGGPASAARS